MDTDEGPAAAAAEVLKLGPALFKVAQVSPPALLGLRIEKIAGRLHCCTAAARTQQPKCCATRTLAETAS